MEKLHSLFHVELQIFSIQDKLKFEVRPNASNGLWLMFLLPISIILSAFKHSIELTFTYKLLPLFCAGFLITNLIIIKSLKNEVFVKFYELWCFVPISILYYFLFNKGFFFSLYSGAFCTIIYYRIYISLLQSLRNSFTLGEAAVTSQALTILIYTTIPHFYYSINGKIVSVGASSTIIIQMELFGILLLGVFLYNFGIKKCSAFYFWTAFFAIFTFLIPVHVFLKRSAILWVWSLLIQDIPTMKMVLYWIICSCSAALSVFYQKNLGNISTSQRKIYHLLAVAVYIPGLIYKCNLLYLGSGILLGIFFLLEFMRILMVHPFGDMLQRSFESLSDEKDSGIIAMTPIYLLCGITLPLWIHPAPCDVTDSAGFNLVPILSGVLSVGIGDTAASICGSIYGKHFFSNSRKTIEGTAACILSQLVTIYVIHVMGFIRLDTIVALRIIISVCVASVLEAKTDQIDNLVLPLVTYILLI